MTVKELINRKFMNPKLLVFDLDGTLLDSKKKISKANIEEITKLKESGVAIAIATARPLAGFADVRNWLDLDGTNSYFISLCGSMVRDGYGKLIESNPVDVEDFHYIDELAKKDKLQAAFYTDYDAYINGEMACDQLLHDLKNLALVVKDIREYDCKNPIGKFVIFGQSDDLDKFMKKYENELSEKFYTMRNNHYMYEIHNKDAGKLEGYKTLLSYTGIDNNKSIVFGDSTNDIRLLSYAGYGVAPQNAKDSVKDVADYVADSDNNSDFIADFLINNIDTKVTL